MVESDKFYCSRCKFHFVEPSEMCWVKGKVRTRCKKCHNEEEKERRLRVGSEKLSAAARLAYKNKVESLSKLDESTGEGLSISIHNWVTKSVNRNTEKRFKERKNLDRQKLKDICFKAKEIFPYITFNNRRKNSGHSAYWASLDRIDPSKPYSDDNVIVVPLWLNSAKLDFSYRELFEIFDMLDREKFFGYIDSSKTENVED